MTVQNIERKCPECGGSARLGATNGVDGKTYYCECESCGLRTADFKTQLSAVVNWNTAKEDFFFQEVIRCENVEINNKMLNK